MPAPARPRPANFVCVGEIRGAFGVRGEVRIASFTADSPALFSYGPLLDETGAVRLTVTSWRGAEKGYIVRAKEIATREEAEAMRGRKLHVPRAALPRPEDDEYYLADLIGLAARHVDGRPMGHVCAVVNYGGGDLLEIAGTPGVKASWHLPFTRESAPGVDVAGGVVTIDPPDGFIPDGLEGSGGTDGGAADGGAGPDDRGAPE